MTLPLAILARRPLALASRFLLSLSARDYPELGMQTCRTGQALTFTRTGGGSASDSNGGVNPAYVANQPRHEALDFDGDGTRESLVRSLGFGGTNLLLRSQDISNAAWTKLQATTSAAPSIQEPDGTLATKLLETAVTNTHGLSQVVTITAANFVTYSVYFRAADRARFQLRALNAADIIACVYRTDLGTVTATASGTSTIQDSGLETLGNGWYRGWVTGKVNAASTSITCEANLVDSTNATNYAGVATSGAFFWGFDFKQHGTTGSLITNFVPTVAATATAGIEALTLPLSFLLGDSLTLYLKFARPLWGSHSGTIPSGNATLVGWGTIAAANSFSVYLDAASPHAIRCALYDTSAATQITVAQSLPAAQAIGRTPVEVCVQLSTCRTAAQARVDVGAGFGALSTAVGVLTTPSGVLGVGCSPAGLLQVSSALQEVRIQSGVFTLAQMRDGY